MNLLRIITLAPQVHVGADGAETEALFRAGLWRLARNDRIPTTCQSDWKLVGDQAAGPITIFDQPFELLRATFQCFVSKHDLLRVDHVRSHAGDPFNELVDWLAEMEPHQSQHLPRQPVRMSSSRPVLPHLWMIVSDSIALPVLTEHGLDIRAPDIPQLAADIEPELAPAHVSNKFSLSFATGNVRALFRGEQGHPGKLHYV